MRSFLSIISFLLLLSLSLPNGVFVDARINTPESIVVKPAITIGSNTNVTREQDNQSITAATVRGVRLFFESSHRSLGGGVNGVSSSSGRSLYQQQEWARDDEGKILWWIWLVIALSGALCFFVCCCASACCLQD
jgi:hypothetical protein